MQTERTHLIQEQTYGTKHNLPFIIMIILIGLIDSIDKSIERRFNKRN